METKCNNLSPEAKQEIGALLSTFEEFKRQNDERLKAIERKGRADTLDEQKVDRINRALDREIRKLERNLRQRKTANYGNMQRKALTPMQKKALETGVRRQRFDLKPSARGVDPQHKAAFLNFMRSGAEGPMRAVMQRKAATLGTSPDGGYLVHSELEMMIDRLVSEVSPIRQVASVQSISGASLRKPWSPGGATAGWVGETSNRPQTTTPTLNILEFPAMELYAMPAATQTLLDDAAVNIEEWLANEVQITFAEQEGAAFVNGDGVAKPRGLLSYTMVADASWATNKIGFITSGGASGFAASNPADKLLDLIYAPKQAFRQNASWLMNRATVSEVRKLKDGNGNYLWQPSLAAGEPATLQGYPIVEAEDMPDIGAGTFPILFGDFKRGYMIVDRIGVRVLRDPYTTKPYILFYTTKRVGGGVQNFEAFKAFKISA